MLCAGSLLRADDAICVPLHAGGSTVSRAGRGAAGGGVRRCRVAASCADSARGSAAHVKIRCSIDPVRKEVRADPAIWCGAGRRRCTGGSVLELATHWHHEGFELLVFVA